MLIVGSQEHVGSNPVVVVLEMAVFVPSDTSSARRVLSKHSLANLLNDVAESLDRNLNDSEVQPVLYSHIFPFNKKAKPLTQLNKALSVYKLLCLYKITTASEIRENRSKAEQDFCILH